MLWSFESELQTNPIPFHLESLWGATLMSIKRVCDGLGWNKIVRVGKKSGPVLSCLWTKVHEIFGQHMRPFILASAFAWLSTSRFVHKISLSVEFAEKPNKCKSFLTPTVLQQIVSATYHLLFGKVLLSSTCWSPTAKTGDEAECRIYRGTVKMQVEF